MKITTLLLFVLITNGILMGQTNTCGTANPFCSAQNYNFPNSTTGLAPTGPNYGCLGSQPRPIWYYMEVGTSGPIDILMQQTTGPNGTGAAIDLDFAMWGPFTSLTAGCASIMSGALAPLQCSFSSSFQEDLGIGVSGGTGIGFSTPPPAVAGQIYIVLLTNFNGQAGFISFNQTNTNTPGAGSADCSIVEPCAITNFTATVSACNPATETYSVNGTISVTGTPPTGNLVVQACGGAPVVVATAPFTASSYNYTITGLNPNGAACNLQTYFTAESTCSQTLSYTAPTCPCTFSNMNANIGACQQGSVFNLTGTLAFTNPPTTGQLIVQDCSGNSATYNAPFTSPLNFAINGINANGAACNATATFTADPSCTIGLNYTNTPSCECTVDIGTFSTTTAGESNSTYVLCYGDEILLEPNGDYTPPGQALNPANPGGYQPGIMWLMYSCPPTVAVTPHPTNDINDDPCFLGIVSTSDMYDFNDMYYINGYPAGTFTNNTIYFVPLTAYNLTEDLYSYVNGGWPCYEMGTPYSVQYLPQITRVITPNCTAGTVSVTVQGGSPAVNGGVFTASNLVPATASITTNNVGNGGTIVISGLQNGNNYSFEISDAYGCPITVTGTFQGINPSGFTYPQAAYCKGSANPLPTITGTTGGTFSGSTGLVINAATGLINIASTPAGNYIVTYTSPGAPCNSSTTFNIAINPLPVVTAPNVSICNGQTATLTATGAATYSWSPATGLNTTTGATVQSTVTATQVYTITGTNTTTGCVGTGSVTVTVNPLPTVNAGNDVSICLGASTTLTASGASTYSWNNGLGAGPTHTVSPTTTTTYEVTGTTAAGCVGTDQITVTVIPLPVVNAGADIAICIGTSTTLAASGATTYSWNNGLGAGVSHSVSPITTTTYTVTGIANGCQNTDQVMVTVNPLPVVNAGPDVAICAGAATTLTASGASTFNWNNGLGAGITHSVSPTVTTTYTVTGTDGNGCVNTDQVIVTVNPNPTPVISGQTEYCAGTPATVQTSQPYTTYSWSNGQTTSSILVTEADNPIQVTVTNSFGCIGTSAIHTVIENIVITTASTIEICQGQSATIHGIVRTTAGVYSNTAPSSNGCDSTSNITLVVHALPIINAGLDNAICIGFPATLVASGGDTYSWSNGLGAGVSHTVSPTITTTYTVTGTDLNGCVNTDNVLITVNPLPIINAGQDVAICIGSSTPLSASGALNYVWNQGLGAGQNHSVSPTVTTTYTVTGTDVNGCVNTDNVTVTVNPLPVINAGPDVSICIGSSTILLASGGATYSWNQGLGVGNGFTVSPTSTTTYIVTGTDVNGCVNTDNIIVTVNPLPIINGGANQQVCEGEPVSLNGSGAPTLVWNPSQTNGVEFVQPVGTQVYEVTGTDNNGCVNTAQTQITVLPNPIITQIPDQVICNSTSFTGINFVSSDPVSTYDWISSNSAIGLPASGSGNIGSFTATNNTNSPITSTITTVATANGCFGDPMLFTITVQPSPTAAISGTAQVCLNETSPVVTFSAANGTAPYTIFYNINNGATQSITTSGTTATLNAPTTAAGLFVYNLVSVEEAAFGCQRSVAGSISITVHALPNVTAGADVFVCNTNPVTLIGGGAGLNGQYFWSNGVLNNVPFVPTTSGTYTVTGIDVNGCNNQDNVLVTINYPQGVDAGQNQAVCFGDPVILTAVSPDLSSSFGWSNGVQNTVSFIPIQSTTYTVTATDENGCISSDVVDVIVNPLPIIDAGANVSGCDGDQYTFSGYGAGSNGSYVWTNGVQNNVPFIPVVGLTTYYVTGTDENGCIGMDSLESKIQPYPEVSFYVEQDNNCLPVSATFYSTSNNFEENVTCLWSFDDGTTVAGCGPVTNIFNYAGTFGATLQVTTQPNGCSSTLYQPAMVVADPNPIAHFTTNPEIGSTLNNQVTFINGSYGATTYEWDFGDGIGTSTEENPVYTYDDEKPDIYTVQLVVYSPAGCPDTAYSVFSIEEELIFYIPNTFTPDQNQYNEVFKPIFTSGFDPYNYTLLIFNRWGEKVFESHDANVGWNGTYGVDGQTCQDGTYTWKIEVKTTMNDERKMFVGHVNLLR